MAILTGFHSSFSVPWGAIASWLSLRSSDGEDGGTLDPGPEAGISTSEHPKPPWPQWLVCWCTRDPVGQSRMSPGIRVGASGTCAFPPTLNWGGCVLEQCCCTAGAWEWRAGSQQQSPEVQRNWVYGDGMLPEPGQAGSCTHTGHFSYKSPPNPVPSPPPTPISLGWAGFSVICTRENSD